MLVFHLHVLYVAAQPRIVFLFLYILIDKYSSYGYVVHFY